MTNPKQHKFYDSIAFAVVFGVLCNIGVGIGAVLVSVNKLIATPVLFIFGFGSAASIVLLTRNIILKVLLPRRG